MPIVSTESNNSLPYHKKVVKAFLSLINSINPDLILTNPILSGSTAVKYIYLPSAKSSDVDLYFQNEKDFEAAFSLLKKDNPKFLKTNNAVTFTELKLQLINKFFLPPEELVYCHDFSNVCCAITKDKVIFSKQSSYAWYMNELHLNKYQVSSNPTNEEELIALNNLLSRVNKYIKNFNLTLSPSFITFFQKKKNFLQRTCPQLSLTKVNPDLLDYYGNQIKENITSQNLIFSIDLLLNPTFNFDSNLNQVDFLDSTFN